MKKEGVVQKRFLVEFSKEFGSKKITVPSQDEETVRAWAQIQMRIWTKASDKKTSNKKVKNTRIIITPIV